MKIIGAFLLLFFATTASASFSLYFDSAEFPIGQISKINQFLEEVSNGIPTEIKERINRPIAVRFSIFSYNKVALICDPQRTELYVRPYTTDSIDFNILLLLKIQNHHMDRNEYGCTFREALVQAVSNLLAEEYS